MTKSTKNLVSDLDPKLAAELLNVDHSPYPMDQGGGLYAAEPLALGDRIRETVKHLATLVAAANEHLGSSEATRLVASALARQHGKRGDAAIYVTTEGRCVVEVGTEIESKPAPPRRKYKRNLPLLEDLRAEAKELRLDISHLGQKRRAIWDAINDLKARKGISVSDDPPEMGAGADEEQVEAIPEGPKPPKRGHFKIGETLSQPRVIHPGATRSEPIEGDKPNMVELLEESSEVNLRDLLGDEGA
jgi:hypothetical protein